MAKDPVCGMQVKVETAQNKCDYKGKTYYFCTPLCMVTFQHDPDRYVKEDKSSSK